MVQWQTRPPNFTANLRNFHGDPADRIIVATTILTGSSLVTADEKILNWEGLAQKVNARH